MGPSSGAATTAMERAGSASSTASDDEIMPLTDRQLQRLSRYRSKIPPAVKYVYGPVIGRGGYGVVRLVNDRQNGGALACKRIWVADDEVERERIGIYHACMLRLEALREIDAMCDLSHPCVARLVEFYEERQSIYIVMELLQGVSLEEAVSERGSLSEGDSRIISGSILKCVQYLHENGVVHRDLKLENVLLADVNDMSSVKLVDFGLACRSESMAPRLVQCCGSPGYVAPEVLLVSQPSSATEHYSKECDMWSVGVLLFVMLSGYPPFEESSIEGELARVAAGDYNFDDPVWELISAEAKHLVRGLMELDPAARLTADEALNHPWLLNY